MNTTNSNTAENSASSSVDELQGELTKRPTILLCWGYNRQGWILPFEKLKRYFRFVYLFYLDKSQEDKVFTDQERIYWGDFASSQEILNQIKPQKVVFMSITSGRTIALNHACRLANIPTYILQHGLFQNYTFYRNLELLSRKQITKGGTFNASIAAAQEVGPHKFFLNSVGYSRLDIFGLVILRTLLERKEGRYFADKHVRFKARIPDYYICYTGLSTTIHRELDKCTDDQILLIGNPEFDSFFHTAGNSPVSVQQEKYMLLIDQPFAGNQYYDMGISKDDMNAFYAKLNKYCLSAGAKLYIKLHPETYKDTWLLQDENIVYYRDAEVVSLIKGADGCFGTFSSLLIPAVYFKKCCIFRLLQSPVQDDLIQRRIVTGLDFKTFAPDEIDFSQIDRSETNLLSFVEDYLYKTDGNAVERLKSILLN